MIQANKTLKSQVKLLSVEFSNAAFNLAAIRSRIVDVLDAILSSDATVASHCCLAIVAVISFSLRMKQLRRQNPKDTSSVQLLVANLFTVGCSGVGDSGDILHSICNAGSKLNYYFSPSFRPLIYF